MNYIDSGLLQRASVCTVPAGYSRVECVVTLRGSILALVSQRNWPDVRFVYCLCFRLSCLPAQVDRDVGSELSIYVKRGSLPLAIFHHGILAICVPLFQTSCPLRTVHSLHVSIFSTSKKSYLWCLDLDITNL